MQFSRHRIGGRRKRTHWPWYYTCTALSCPRQCQVKSTHIDLDLGIRTRVRMASIGRVRALVTRAWGAPQACLFLSGQPTRTATTGPASSEESATKHYAVYNRAVKDPVSFSKSAASDRKCPLLVLHLQLSPPAHSATKPLRPPTCLGVTDRIGPMSVDGCGGCVHRGGCVWACSVRAVVRCGQLGGWAM
jgi:hypothetical protein